MSRPHTWRARTADGSEPKGTSQQGRREHNDRYGLSWQIVPTALIEMLGDPDPEKAKRTTEAMFAMTKLDIAAPRKAYAGD